MEFELGGIVRRSNQTLDDVFYFLPERQIVNASKILNELQHMALDFNVMTTWRANLRKVAQYTMFGSETMDDALTVSLGLLLGNEYH
jgi:hypothetical protein